MSEEGEIVQMKMAKASVKDLENAITLCGMIEDIDRECYPRDANNEWPDDDPQWFDIDDPQHCQVFARRILNVSRGIGRVIWGMNCMMNPENNLIDPDADTLEFHPRVVAGWKLLDAQKEANGDQAE
jgi:hypothetical protein